jgi:RNA polymerase sigma-70 factor, ECF subfamily
MDESLIHEPLTDDPGTISIGPDNPFATDPLADPLPDDRLRLIFTCAHPALSMEARVALTLRMVGGLTVPEIASAFLVRDATMGQRISRAKRKIAEAGIPYRVPTADDLPVRLEGVLAALFLIFNEGYLASSPDSSPIRVDLCLEATRLARLLHGLLPDEGEVTGLLALMLLIGARHQARVSSSGELVTLDDQDRGSWDRAAIAEGHALVRQRIATGVAPGRYQLLAAINAVHTSVAEARDTDWEQIVTLYDQLSRVDPSPVVALNRAVAVAELDGPRVALAQLTPLADALSAYHPFHVVRAELMRRLGDSAGARAAYSRALELATNSAERAHLSRRLGELGGD